MWRIPELMLVADPENPRLGALGCHALGGSRRRFEETAWRSRPVVAALGLYLLLRGRVAANELISVFSGTEAESGSPFSALCPDVMQRHLEKLKWAALAERDLELLWNMRGSLCNTFWRSEFESVDQLVALQIFPGAPRTSYWTMLAREGVNGAIAKGLYACRRIDRALGAVMENPADFEVLWRNRRSVERLDDESHQFAALTRRYRVALSVPCPLSGWLSLRQVWNRAEMAEFIDLGGETVRGLSAKIRVGTCSVFYKRRSGSSTWWVFSGNRLFGEEPRLQQILCHHAGRALDCLAQLRTDTAATLRALGLPRTRRPIELLGSGEGTVLSVTYQEAGALR